MNTRGRLVFSAIFALAICSTLLPTDAYAGSKIGKLFITSAPLEGSVGDKKFLDPDLEESVGMMKKRPGDFVLVENEADADFILKVVKRESQAMPGQPDDKRVFSEFSMKDGGEWKLITKFNIHSMYWNLASRDTVAAAEKFVKKNLAK